MSAITEIKTAPTRIDVQASQSGWGSTAKKVALIAASAILCALVGCAILYFTLHGAVPLYFFLICGGSEFAAGGIGSFVLQAVLAKDHRYTHIQHQHGLSGALKICKYATRVINGKLQRVARLVIRPLNENFDHILKAFQHGIKAIQKLKDVPGIYEHFDHCVRERITRKERAMSWKIESYDREYEKGDINSLLYEKHVHFTDLLKNRWLLTLLNALSEMHRRGIYHRDIKTENILVAANDDIAICDFDDCWMMDDPEDEIKAVIGTPLILSPETVFQRNPCQFQNRTTTDSLAKNDVWAMGLALYELFFGQPLHECEFPEPDDLMHLQFICEEPKDKQSREHVIWEMLQVDPNKRISADEAYIKMKDAVKRHQATQATTLAN